MTEMTKYSPGTFSWIDLETTDAEGAKTFYTKLFGWSSVDYPIDDSSVYTMLQIDGKDVAALYKMNEEQSSQGIPPHWVSYVTVANADESAEKAKSLGGQVLMEPFDVMDAGRMAVVQDPTGATLAVWEPKESIGAHLVNESGTLCWNELATRDREKAGQFYMDLFGWTDQPGPDTTSMPYTMFMNNDQMNGGMLQMNEEWGDIPSHWMVYFAVEDCDASAAKAEELGGVISVPPTDIPPTGRFSVIQDPQGGVFSIIELTPQN